MGNVMFAVGLFARNCDKSQTRSNVSKKCQKPIFNSIAAVFLKWKRNLPENVQCQRQFLCLFRTRWWPMRRRRRWRRRPILTLAELAAIECIKCPFLRISTTSTTAWTWMTRWLLEKWQFVLWQLATKRLNYFGVQGTVWLIAFHVGQGLIPSMSK